MTNALAFFITRQSEDPLKLAVEEWTAAVNLATRLEFDVIREFAIRCIETQYGAEHHAIDRIDLSISCGIDKWLHPAYDTLCVRNDPITAEEGSRLGHERSAAIWRIREAYRSESSLSTRCGGCSACCALVVSKSKRLPCLSPPVKSAMQWIIQTQELEVPVGSRPERACATHEYTRINSTCPETARSILACDIGFSVRTSCISASWRTDS